MRIRLRSPELLPDLLRFMRNEGCIAYYQSDAEVLQVLRPHAFGSAEAHEISSLLARWSVRHPGAEPELLSDSD